MLYRAHVELYDTQEGGRVILATAMTVARMTPRLLDNAAVAVARMTQLPSYVS